MSAIDWINGFGDAQKRVFTLKLEVAGTNHFAWSKLDRLMDYLRREQTAMAEEYFREDIAA